MGMWRTATGLWDWLGWRKLFLFGGFWTVAVPGAAYVITQVSAWFGASVEISSVDYVLLAIAGLLGFLLVHLFRRVHELESQTKPHLTLEFFPDRCIRDVNFPQGGMSRYVSVVVRGLELATVKAAAVYLHEVEYFSEGFSERVDIEGSPHLEWAQTPGHVVAYDPQTLVAGRAAIVNVLYCTDNPFPADMHICSPQLLIREHNAMGLEGQYKVTIRAACDGMGKYAEIVLRVSWDGAAVESLNAELWN